MILIWVVISTTDIFLYTIYSTNWKWLKESSGGSYDNNIFAEFFRNKSQMLCEKFPKKNS